jgi:hypothetical protein
MQVDRLRCPTWMELEKEVTMVKREPTKGRLQLTSFVIMMNSKRPRKTK